MTTQRVAFLMFAVLIGVAAAFLQNWWTFAAMVIVATGLLHRTWRERRSDPTRDSPTP